MKFAYTDGTKIEATPNAKGCCPGCGEDLIPRCGTKNIWHWAHKGRPHCDTWWESETEWHRGWKSHFPDEWQEVAIRNDRGKLHIADVRSPDGFVCEFQHSAIPLREARLRTLFYKTMLWVIDGTRRVTDLKQFKKSLFFSLKTNPNLPIRRLYDRQNVRLCNEWFGLGVTVAIDFGGGLDAERGWSDLGRDLIWIQPPKPQAVSETLNLPLRKLDEINILRRQYGFVIPRAKFIELLLSGKPLPEIRFRNEIPIYLNYG
jgi:hypothetical protein